MPSILVHVFADHPLNRLHTYLKLPVARGVSVTSIEMGAMYVALKKEGRPDLADALLEEPTVRWQPQRIREWIRGRNVELSVETLVNTDLFYRAVLKQQFKKKSDFARTYRKALEDWDGESPVQFIVYSGSGELVMSTGLKGEKPSGMTSYTGFNVYGKLLEEMLPYVDKKTRVGNSVLRDLLSSHQIGGAAGKKSVLVIADSQPRYFETVSRGDVVPLGGAKYEQILKELNSGKYDFDEYKWLIIYVGTNVKLTARYPYEEREYWLNKLIDRLAEIAESRATGTVLFSCAFDHPSVPGNDRHSREVERKLLETNVMCLNWSNPPGNPFVGHGGKTVNRYYFQAENRYDYQTRQNTTVHFHLNHNGLREVWLRWCQFLPGLKFFTYALSPVPLSVRRDVYEAEHRAQQLKRQAYQDYDDPNTYGESSHARRVYDPDFYGEPSRKRPVYEQ